MRSLGIGATERWLIVVMLLMGVGLSLLGGLYPAARAAALEPTEALRYE